MIRVRSARPDEVHVLAKIGIAAWRMGIKPHVTAQIAQRIERENPFISFLRNHGSKVLVAEFSNTPVGIGGSENTDNEISDLWVSPKFKGKGGGSALIRAMEQVISGQGFREASIQVAAKNERALGLYQHLGFVEQWRRKEFDPVLQTTLEKVGLTKPL